MLIREFKSSETLNKLWWLHDSFWHAELVRELGPDLANRFNWIQKSTSLGHPAPLLARRVEAYAPESVVSPAVDNLSSG